MSQSKVARTRLVRTVRTLLMASAAWLAADAALAANVLNIDISGSGTVRTLRIKQDATNPSNVISANGTAGGAGLQVRGPWNTLSVTQLGANNTLGGAVRSGASTTAALSLTYGTGVTGGNNQHSLTIGGTTAPVNPSVTVAVINSAPATPNTITDVLDGSSLTYGLTLTGTANVVSNTLAASGAVTLSETITGGAAGLGNNVTNTITGATSINGVIVIASDDNDVTNTSTSAGAKVFNVNLPSGSNGNTVVNDFTGGSGAQSSTLTLTGSTSRIDYGLTASGAGTSVNATLSNINGENTDAAVVRVLQTGAGASLTLTIDGGSFEMGSDTVDGQTGGILVNQASAGAIATLITSASSDGYTFAISQ